MGFRRPFFALSETAGSYVSGEYVPGTKSSSTIQASIQPVTVGTDMDALPEGRRLSDFCKVYTASNLKITEEAQGIQPDLVVWPEAGYAYEIVSKFVHQMGIIPHYKYIAVKRIKIATTPAALVAGWLNGTVTR